jgi:putative holliday junction resolvase
MEKASNLGNETETSHILGIDFGASKVGLAMAETETKIAFSSGVLKNDKNMFHELREICQEEEVGIVVVGLPRISGFENEKKQDSQKSYREFAEKLKTEMPKVQIFFADEMFTTKMARENLKESAKRNLEKIDDAEAARIILQSWLDATY